jgi:catechol 2,3-dioxygenase-like lactoylglutathione lyase family enzyme
LPSLDPERFIWYRAGGDLELHVMLLDEPRPESAHFCLAVDDVSALRRQLEAAGVETRDSTPIVGRPRFTCRDPFGNLVELAEVGS